MSTDGQAATSAGRPRSEEAHAAILDATLELLVEVGYPALTVEGIATRAGVGKATIYRRWSSKLPLVIEAFGQLPALEEADTGDLVADLESMLNQLEEESVHRAAAAMPTIAIQAVGLNLPAFRSQHRLNFLPLPHGQSWFRPTFETRAILMDS